MNAAVEVETSFRPVALGFNRPVRVSLRYDAADPYAVHASFHYGNETVTWSLARDVLANGLDEPAGAGDVLVWPWSSPRGDFVALSLSSPDGCALFEIERSILVRFLRRTYAVVPRGQESDHVDLDELVRMIMDRGGS
jgi:hypothetical protein